MKTPDYKLQAPLKTIDELIDWLRTTKPRALCLIAEGDSPSQVHMVMFNADKAFFTPLVYGLDAAATYADTIAPPDNTPPAPMNRSERRRMYRGGGR